MSDAAATGLDRLKDPAYTGANRCLPCTVVNVAIALAGSAVLAVLWLPAGPLAFAGALLVIYFRGYLVPGTPTLTKRYLPERVLGWFGKAPPDASPGDAPEVDVAEVLLDAGVLRPGAEDVHLVDDVREAWWAEIERVRDRDPGPGDIATVLSFPEHRLDVREHGDARVAYLDERYVGRWESRAALVADVAGVPVLEGRVEDWADLAPGVRSELLGGLRLFLERCPACDGDVSMATDTVESCCAEHEVLAVTCADCGARLLETDAPDPEAAEAAAGAPA